MLEQFHHEDLIIQFWAGLVFMVACFLLLLKFQKHDLAWVLLPWGILVGFGSTMFAVIEFSGGVGSFLGFVETIVTIIATLIGIFVSLKKILADKEISGTKRPQKKKSRR